MTDFENWKSYFVKMAEGKLGYKHFHVVDDNSSNEKARVVEPTLNLVAPTQQAVEMAKVELDESIRGERAKPYSKRKPPPGVRRIKGKNNIWN